MLCSKFKGAIGGMARATVRAAGALALGQDRRQIAGRFWVLADEDDDEEDGEAGGGSPEMYSPTPSDMVCELFSDGYDEEEVATVVEEILPPDDPDRVGLRSGKKTEIVRRVVHRRTTSSAIRPWKGPIPKVSLPKLTLLDLVPPEAWTKVVGKKKGRRAVQPPPPASPAIPIGIRAARLTRLKELVGSFGPDLEKGGPRDPEATSTGYTAQVVSADHGPQAITFTRRAEVGNTSIDGSSSSSYWTLVASNRAPTHRGRPDWSSPN